MGVVVLTYHAVEAGPRPLCLDPALFAAHADVIVESGARVLTVSALVTCLRAGRLPARGVAITFDDGIASAVGVAAPILAERGLTATFYCVAGRLGAHNDWPTQRPRFPRLGLASAEALSEAARNGFELGSHGLQHFPLGRADAERARREIVDSKGILEDAVQAPFETFAYPYGISPSPTAADLVSTTYAGACTGGPSAVSTSSEPYAVPRVDAHYVRGPDALRRLLDRPPGLYLGTRRLGARCRRLLVQDALPLR